MIHIIYSYFIIAATLFGYLLGDTFNEDPLIKRLLISVFWIVITAKKPLIWLWNLDATQMTLVHLGFNRLKGNENCSDIIESLNRLMVPVWQKWWYGKYLINGLSKLKKMNSYSPNQTTHE